MPSPAIVTQAQMIADIFYETRKLTRFYLNKVDPTWAEWQYVADGVRLNSAYWLIAHLTWAEHALLMASLGGPKLDIPWLNHYALGTDGTLHEGRPSFEELVAEFNRVQAHAMECGSSLTDEQLETPADTSAIQWNTTKRKVAYHAIRHEGTHVGHFGWLCKIKGVKTI
ncbi:hypothetical protein BH09BAC1_BH09BAC1_24390 [soil metagenome]